MLKNNPMLDSIKDVINSGFADLSDIDDDIIKGKARVSTFQSIVKYQKIV